MTGAIWTAFGLAIAATALVILARNGKRMAVKKLQLATVMGHDTAAAAVEKIEATAYSGAYLVVFVVNWLTFTALVVAREALP